MAGAAAAGAAVWGACEWLIHQSTGGNERDSGLAGVSDADVSAGARDNTKSKEEWRRFQKEEKARGFRNKAKRSEQQSK